MGTLQAAFFWSALERFGSQGIQVLLSIILARLLSPVEFGLIGMVMVFCSLGQLFADSGLSTALVQRQSNSADDEATVFYLNLGAGLVLTLLICAVSPLVARFYGQPILVPLLCVLSLQVVLSSGGIIQFALLTRTLDFRRQSLVNMAAVLLSGTVGVIMALRGWGVWSLAGQYVSAALGRSLLIWMLGPWRPAGRFRRTSFQALWPFSYRLLAAGLLNTVFENLYNVFIGRMYRPAELGLFTRAQSLAQAPAGFMTSVFGRITLPVFSQMQTDAPLLKDKVRRVFRLLAAVHFPAMTALAVVAEPLVRVVLTDKWAPCVPYLQVLAFAGLLYPLHALHLNMLLALGRSDLFLRVEIIKKVLVVLALAATFRFGVLAMVWGILVLSVVCLAVNTYYTRKLLHYHSREQALDLAPVVGASLLMALAMLAVPHLYPVGLEAWVLQFEFSGLWLLLLGQTIVGVLVYGAIVWFSRFMVFSELRTQVFSFVQSWSVKPAEGSV